MNDEDTISADGKLTWYDARYNHPTRTEWRLYYPTTEVLENPVIQEIAERIKATPAQVVLAWQMQRGVAVIPKSVHEAHLRENYASLAIELDEADMAKIATLDKNYRFISGDAFANGSYANLWDEAN